MHMDAKGTLAKPTTVILKMQLVRRRKENTYFGMFSINLQPTPLKHFEL